MVDVRTYQLWQELACRDDLPAAALHAVIEALTTPVPYRDTISSNWENWRTNALQTAMPVLLARTTEPELRTRLVAASSRDQIIQFILDGLLAGEDAPAITAAHPVWPGLVAGLGRHEHQVPTAVDLLTNLPVHEVGGVISAWESGIHLRGVSDPAQPMPAPLFTAVLERSLQPLVDSLTHPEDCRDWAADSYLSTSWGTDFGSSEWRVLEYCPSQWPQLVRHPRYGRVVQHILLDHADTDALSDELLAACLPALTWSERAQLPKPTVTERRRLADIARRTDRHPRLREIAADQLHAAADACVVRGRLLHSSGVKRKADYEVSRLADDLALTCGTPQHLAKICGVVGALPQPSVVATPARTGTSAWWRQEEELQPRFLLGTNGDHRVKALARLACNAYTPREALTKVLAHLHPVEIAWLQQHADLPTWFREATAAFTPAASDDGVVRILTDEELDAHPDPESVLQSWLNAPRCDELDSRDIIERAVLSSRHRTEALLRQLSADTVLAHGIPGTAAPLLTNLCGDHPQRWAALLAALEHVDSGITFGEFLDALSPKEASMMA